MPVPTQPPEQRQQGLQKARETRQQRAQIRQQLKSGELTVQKVLDRSDEEVIARMRVSYLLESLPQVGKATGNKIMKEIGIDITRRVKGLGSRQLEALVKRFS